jgi:molecular chaperone HtpG
VQEVRVSTRLRESPACLVLGEHDMGASMRRIMAAAGQKVPESKPVLEVNTTHGIVKYLDGMSDEEHFKELAELLFDQASLAEGSQLGNPAEYVQRLNRLLVRLAGLPHS